MVSPASRITVDIDAYQSNVRLRVLRAYHGLHDHDAVTDVVVAVSSSQQGFHLEGYCDERVGVVERLRVRRALGDDSKRVELDEERAMKGLPIGTMWTSKGDRDGERRVFGDDVEAALEFVGRTSRSAAERAHGIQQHGHRALDADVPHSRAITRT